MKYIKPSIIDCGKSESVIKGDCGWGGEGWAFDAEGSYQTSKNRQYICDHIGPIIGGYDVYCCRTEQDCSTSSDHC